MSSGEAVNPLCDSHAIPKKWIGDRSRKAGGKWRCPACAKKTMSGFRKRNADTLPQRDRERMAKRRANPETNKKIRRSRRHSARKSRRIMSAVYELDPELLSEEDLILWERMNKEKLRWREAASIRKARMKNAICPHCEGGGYMEHASGTCYICHNADVSHVDHVIPLAKGGMHCDENFLGACAPCNWSKGSRTWPGERGWEDFVSEMRS